MNSYANEAACGTWPGQLLTDFEEERRVFFFHTFSTAISVRFCRSTKLKMGKKMSQKEGEKTGILFGT